MPETSAGIQPGAVVMPAASVRSAIEVAVCREEMRQRFGGCDREVGELGWRDATDERGRTALGVCRCGNKGQAGENDQGAHGSREDGLELLASGVWPVALVLVDGDADADLAEVRVAAIERDRGAVPERVKPADGPNAIS
jgi:hypothetical protein